jgi:quercetin dioxygenase-like cupin family protein
MTASALQRFPHVPAHAGEAYNVIGERLTFKVMTDDTNGQFSVMELIANPGGGPPLHTHPSAEALTIIEGEFEISGLENGAPYSIRAKPGDTIFVPAGAPHTYSAVGTTPGKAMLVFTPGGEMERFFAEAGVAVQDDEPAAAEPPDIPTLISVAQKHGMVFLGP